MTCLNVLLLGDRALVAMDTRVLNPLTGEVWNSSKMFPMVHANILFACRGERVLAEIVLDWFLYKASCEYDDISLLLPEELPRIAKKFEATTGRKLTDDELVVVGWSKAKSAMMVVACAHSVSNGGFTITHMKNGYIAPSTAESISFDPDQDLELYLTELALSQRRFSERHQPEYLVGGKLVLAEITRDSMAFRTIADLDTP